MENNSSFFLFFFVKERAGDVERRETIGLWEEAEDVVATPPGSFPASVASYTDDTFQTFQTKMLMR